MTLYSGSYCSFVTVPVPARSLNNTQNDPIVGHFEAKMLFVGIKMTLLWRDPFDVWNGSMLD